MSTQQVTEYYLRIPEILISIFEHLPAKDIYNCSKVCKEWDHLAFSTLGRIHAVRFDNLIAILGLAPFSYARLDDRKLKLGLLGDNILNHVTEFRWDRFLRLCAPVRELCAGRDWEHKLIMDTILNLLAKFQGQMLPKLETVKMTSISFKGNNQLPEGFFTSRVKRVLLQHPQHVSTRRSHCDRLVQVLQRKSPHLEELEFPCVTPGDVISFSAFQSFKSLQQKSAASQNEWVYIVTGYNLSHKVHQPPISFINRLPALEFRGCRSLLWRDYEA
ncbi:hypothetical protein FRC02_003680 [Tulasnella sp. 418]|nr:hypothetical protein FRC02_003680 [Tulasnella sp. 418]